MVVLTPFTSLTRKACPRVLSVNSKFGTSGGSFFVVLCCFLCVKSFVGNSRQIKNDFTKEIKREPHDGVPWHCSLVLSKTFQQCRSRGLRASERSEDIVVAKCLLVLHATSPRTSKNGEAVELRCTPGDVECLVLHADFRRSFHDRGQDE